VGLLNREPKAARPRKARPPRVYLDREETKQTMRLKPMERNVAYVAAAYCAVAMTLIQIFVRGTDRLWWLGISFLLVAAFAVLTWRTNRMFAGIGAILCVYGPAWGKYVIFGTPLFALMLWLTFRISSDRRKMIEDRTARGDFGVDPRTAADQARKAKKTGTAATETVSGKALAPASKRYTPPKQKSAAGKK
jgi:hypothetical protein